MFVLLRRFQTDERGVFMVLFALLALVLVAVAGAVVDYATVEQARARGQLALDAAALALQPLIYSQTPTQLRTRTTELLTERIDDPGVVVEIDPPEIDTTDGRLLLSARLTIQTSFVSLVGVSEINARLYSEATRKKLNIEIAMVLDNSGSMASSNRMTNLKSAAINAANILFDGAASQPNVFVSVVPFTQFVNVGTGNATASWIDSAGNSPIANDNFDNDDNSSTAYNAPVDRLALFNLISNVSWGGCVEARPYPLDTNDTPPSASKAETLFVPLFAPDEPSGFYNSYLNDTPSSCDKVQSCRWTEVRTGCNSSGSSCTGSTTNTYQATQANGAVTTGSNVCSCTGEIILSDTTTSTGSGYNRTRTRVRTCNDSYTPPSPSDRVREERLCKYNGTAASYTSHETGPNVDCPATAILPLTNVRSQVVSRINAMSAVGGTNIHEGAIWGWRVLSPTAPFTEGRDYDTATSKVMILMTDGENFHSSYNNINGAYYYGAYAYPYNLRLGAMGLTTTMLEALMDTRTLEACTNAKAAGIVIYTIGLSPPNNTTINMLRNCASGTSFAYFPTKPSELNDVFTEIAAQLATLRLAR